MRARHTCIYMESITRHGQCNVWNNISARTERIFQSRHEGGGRKRRESGESGQRKRRAKPRRQESLDSERTIGVRTEGERDQASAGADRGCGTRPEDGDAWSIDSGLANIALGAPSIEPDSRMDHTRVKGERRLAGSRELAGTWTLAEATQVGTSAIGFLGLIAQKTSKNNETKGYS
jgi:hypothetical protein